MDFSHFNPQSQKEEDFLANFVARIGVLEYLLRELRLLVPSRAANHHLIIAPRGYGKTSLLRRLAIAVKQGEDLKRRLIALSFREEQHNVISLDVFWRNCLQSLLEVREDEEASAGEIEQLDAAWIKHAPRQSLKREDQDGEPVKQEFNTQCQSLGRRPLLLIDNLDALLAGLPESHQWLLRNDLQSEGGPILIAAASRYPESTHNPRSAFYDFFRIQTLDRLDDHEVMQCLRIRAEHRGDAGKRVLDLINKDSGRIAALNTLSGGNPRTLGVLYSVLESHASADVLSQLSAMLDTFTGWYQARTEELPIQSRAVFDALALNWDPMTAAALGEATGLDTTATSSQLSRLEKSGYVEAVSLSKRRKGRNGYQVSERFFNIWYLMRNGPRRARQSIKFLTVVLQSCFSSKEQQSIARGILEDEQADPSYTLALASGMRVGRLRNQLIEHADAQTIRLGRAEEYVPAIQELRSTDASRQSPIRQRKAGSGAQFVDGQDQSLRNANALFNKGVTLGQLGRSEDAIEVYGGIVARYGDAPEPGLREVVARALFNKGFMLGQLGRSEDAIEVYDGIAARYGDAPEPGLRERVARALVNKGFRLGQLGRSEDAFEVYDGIAARYGNAPEPGLREQVARALVNKGVTLGQLGRSDEAIEVYDRIAAQYGDAPEPGLRERVAIALNHLGNMYLDHTGSSAKALSAYERGLARNPSSGIKSLLHSNFAYALALHSAEFSTACEHVIQALELGDGVAGSGRDLLNALVCLSDSPATRWQSMFEHIGRALEREDAGLWTDYLDDLQRLLWYVIDQGKESALRAWFDARQYAAKYAPLYHAFVAAVEGEEHLMRVNPETRQAAMRIYAGLAQRLRLYPKAK